MPDDNTAGATQADATATTPAQAATTTTPTTQAVSGKAPLSADDYERKLAEANKEAAANRVALKKYQEAEEAAKLAALDDLGKAQARADKAEKQIQTYKTELINAQVRLAAKDKGIIDPDIAALALHDKLEFGDDGMPSNLDKALDELIKSKPYLVPAPGQAQPASAAQTNTPAVPAMNPGRSSITQPGSTPGRRVTLDDIQWKR